MSEIARVVAFLDASVLYPALLRNLLMHLALRSISAEREKQRESLDRLCVWKREGQAAGARAGTSGESARTLDGQRKKQAAKTLGRSRQSVAQCMGGVGEATEPPSTGRRFHPGTLRDIDQRNPFAAGQPFRERMVGDSSRAGQRRQLAPVRVISSIGTPLHSLALIGAPWL